ncbi:hypothetical protein V8C43DRAFT_275716 [Trichoderma afarasin]
MTSHGSLLFLMVCLHELLGSGDPEIGPLAGVFCLSFAGNFSRARDEGLSKAAPALIILMRAVALWVGSIRAPVWIEIWGLLQ